MTRHRRIRSSIARRLRLSPDRFAAAAAMQDPSLLLALRAARSDDEEPPDNVDQATVGILVLATTPRPAR